MDRIIFLGGFSGGLDAVTAVLRKLDTDDIAVAVIAVLHLGSGSIRFLLEKVQAVTKFEVVRAEHEQPIEASRFISHPLISMP